MLLLSENAAFRNKRQARILPQNVYGEAHILLSHTLSILL